MDVAFGLLLAADAWEPGEANGTYVTAARTMVAAIMAWDVDQATLMLRPGDTWGGMDPLPCVDHHIFKQKRKELLHVFLAKLPPM